MDAINLDINLCYNKGYTWTNYKEVYFIGYAWLNNQKISTAKELFNTISQVHNFLISNIKQLLTDINGAFSLIVYIQQEQLIYCDKTRFFPLFYHSSNNNTLCISDDINYIRNKYRINTIDFEAQLHFLAIGFTPASKTLFKNINQVRPGEAVFLKNNTIEKTQANRWAIAKQEFVKEPFKELKRQASLKINKAFEIHFELIKNMPVLLPLSGGFDSRLIAAKLKEHGFKDVLCFTFGRKTKEVEISRKVAQKLGYPWHYVEYNEQLLKNFNAPPYFPEFTEYAARGTSMFYLQEYPAVKYLYEHRIIDDSMIVIPGHTGDFCGGSNLVKSYPVNFKMNQLTNILFQKRFIHSKLNRDEKRIVKKQIGNYFAEKLFDGAIPYSLIEEWDHLERLPKYIFNAAHVFDYFNLKSIFPYWDKDLVKFFRTVPYEFRKYQLLNHQVLKETYFAKFNIDFSNDIQPSSRDISISVIKKKIRPYLPKYFKNKLLIKNDWVEYGSMTEILKKDIKPSELRENGNSYQNRILTWYIKKIMPGLEQTNPSS